MRDKNTGGSAFPSHGTMGEVCQEGMTLRDYLASKAMQAILPLIEIHDEHWRKELAWGAYQMADAMIEARAA